MTLPQPMTEEPRPLDDATLLQVVSKGDTSRLTPEQRLAYYKARCDVAGLDYRATPFAYITLNGKEVLYALKSATDQLAAKHGIVCEIVSQTTEHDMRTVVVRARTRDGRQTDEIGVVSIGGLKGDQLANALMKAVTKAKRRGVLAVCGLGMLDETELETIPGAGKSAMASLVPPQRLAPADVAMSVPNADEAPPAATLTLEPTDDGDAPISQREIVALTEAVRASGKTEARFKVYLKQKYALTSRKDIPRRLYEELMTWAKEGA